MALTAELLMIPFLFIRAYFCDMGSYQIMSPVLKPKITSIWLVDCVNLFTSWQMACALVKSTFVMFSVFISDGADRSSHMNARLTFANAKIPSAECSANRFTIDSCGITLETKDELLFTMLFFGFGRSSFFLPFTATGKSAGLPSPNVALDPASVVEPYPLTEEPASLFVSSCMLWKFDLVLCVVVVRNRLWDCGGFFGAKTTVESFVPAVGGPMVVANGLLFG